MGRHEDPFKYEIPLTCIASFTKDKRSAIDIICKDVRVVRLS